MVMMLGWQFADADLCAALGLPENVISFTLRAEIKNVVRIECVYYPPSEGIAMFKKRLKEFELIEKRDVGLLTPAPIVPTEAEA